MEIKAQGAVVALGTFDGVHAGHRALISEAAGLAKALHASPLIYTFRNHPLSLFGREAPAADDAGGTHCRRLRATGIPVAAMRLTHSLHRHRRGISCACLWSALRCAGLLPGSIIPLGIAAPGDTVLLKTLGEELGIAVRVLGPVSYENEPVSSTRIRACLEQGELETANAMLGTCYALSGAVTANRRIGHALGFPTANLEGYGNKVLPLSGVYAARAFVAGEAFNAVTNVGNNPTVEGRSTTVETHLLDFERDIYGMPLRVEFVARLRGEVKFPSREALAAQIAADAAHARAILK